MKASMTSGMCSRQNWPVCAQARSGGVVTRQVTQDVRCGISRVWDVCVCDARTMTTSLYELGLIRWAHWKPQPKLTPVNMQSLHIVDMGLDVSVHSLYTSPH